MQIICLNCNKYPATKDPRFGYLPCQICRDKLTNKPSPKQELTTDKIKNDRKEFKKDIYQPFRNGQLSKEYVDAVGTKYIKATPEEIKNAKNIWSDLEYYESGD